MARDETLQNNKTVDRFTQEKLYIQLMRIFLELINSGNWQLGQQIPTEEDLCKKYDVSKITVRQAINNLVSDGYLIKIQGKGTFVAGTLPVVGLAMKTKLTEEMFGKEVKLERKVLFQGIKEPSPDIRAYLKTEDRIYCILSKRIVDRKTAYIEEAFIPYQMLQYIEKLDITHSSLYSVLQEKGTKKDIQDDTDDRDFAGNRRCCKEFGYRRRGSCAGCTSAFFSSDNTPVAYTKIQGRSDRYKFQTEFERIR
ncbi:GntR family transcriptional regulator [Dissulfurispira sp.]|uniref:GntR family transcriptional regulator n=1 Tax=Dissulfurispira sp. TaxID=2817609 RepID=UPI002FDA2E54